MTKQSFYITTTLPYVNAAPHIGFAMEIITADVIARYYRLLGEEVIFNTGTDEHGQKIYQNAIEAGETPQDYVDRYAAEFGKLKNLLNLSYDRFIRTTNPEHKQAAQEFWRRCLTKGDIYKKQYAVKYCIGCELEKTDSELVDSRCPLHPNRELEVREEENYFFKFSKYETALRSLYEQNPKFVVPSSKQKEIASFVNHGLQDFSISRLKSKMPWGVPVPDDDDHVMYVWFDALINYISTLGWPNNPDIFSTYWPGVQIAGKDNLRQQSAMWQAMLISAGLPNSQQILINGFISVAGQKMSKSLGNVIRPEEMIERYGRDGTRFLLLLSGPVCEDIDVSWEQFDVVYTSRLSNGLGNLISRVAKLCERSDFEFGTPKTETKFSPNQSIEEYAFAEGLHEIWQQITVADHLIDETQPWKLEGEALRVVLDKLVFMLRSIGTALQPYMPETSEFIQTHFNGPKVVAAQPVFPRLPKKDN